MKKKTRNVLAFITLSTFLLVGIGLLWFYSGFGSFGSGPEAKFSLRRDWRPEMPRFLIEKIKKRFNDSPENQRAMLQLGSAFWQTLDPNGDLDVQLKRFDRALDCFFFREIPYGASFELKEMVFFTNQLVLRYLLWDRQLAGGIYPGRIESGSDCD